MACEYWKLLFGSKGAEWGDGRTPWLEWWMHFLGERWKKAVNRDLWDQTAVFAEKTKQDPSMEWWSEDGAWPGVVDEFVEWVRGEKGIAGGDVDGAMEVE